MIKYQLCYHDTLHWCCIAFQTSELTLLCMALRLFTEFGAKG